MLQIEDIEIKTDENGWQPEKQYWYNHLLTLTSRIKAYGKDVTGNMGNDWYAIACCCTIFGEQGREPFHTISATHPEYDKDTTDEKFNKCLKKSFKTLRKLEEICAFHRIDIKRVYTGTNMTVSAFMQGFDDEAKADADLYGVCDKNYCTFVIEKRIDKESGNVIGIAPVQIANFIMNIRYLIKHKTNPLRILEVKYKTPMGEIVEMTLAIPTDEFATRASFKKFIERHAGISFKGTDEHLDKIKQRFFPHEKQSTKIEVLGWYGADKLYFYNNGAYTTDGRFYPVSANGFVEIEDKAYYIPSANQNDWFDENSFGNKRKFVLHKDGPSFDTWAQQYTKVYGKPGWLGMCFAAACMYSDIIYNYCGGFVMIYLQGPASGGKGSLIKSTQSLWGEPQTPLPIPGRKASEKSKVRKLAQFVNAMVLMDEYPEHPTPDIEEGTKLLWDRMGDSRALKDYSYDTEDVPISSGIMLTSNYRVKNEALQTRLIVCEIKRGEPNEEETKQFMILKDMEKKGISNVGAEILKHRDTFRNKFVDAFKEQQGIIMPAINAMRIREDRVVKNACMLLATYKALENVLAWPFTYDDFKQYLLDTIKAQHRMRQTTDKVSQWWVAIMKSIMELNLKHGVHFDIDADRLAIVWMDCYLQYVQSMRSLNQQLHADRREMREYLESSEYFVENKASYRFKNTPGADAPYNQSGRLTSVMLFDLNALHKAGFTITDAVYSAQKSYTTHTGASMNQPEQTGPDTEPQPPATETQPPATEITQEQRSLFKKMEGESEVPF